jgi:hypothetical protein
MAQINDIVTAFELQAVTRLLAAEEALRDARAAVYAAQDEWHKRADHLTKVYFDESGGERTSSLPEQFAIEYNGNHWLVTIDVEGDNSHRLNILGGLIAEVK